LGRNRIPAIAPAAIDQTNAVLIRTACSYSGIIY